MVFCDYCLKGYTCEDLLAKHTPDCQLHAPQRKEMPTEDDKFLKFKNFHLQLPVPIVIYADFESCLQNVPGCEADPSKSSTTPIEKHIPSGFGYKFICANDKYSKPTLVYQGADAVPKLIQKKIISIKF